MKERAETVLCALARKHSSDKGGRHQTYDGEHADITHEYTPVYHAIFGERRASVRRVFEIGINRGCSLRLWAEYFPNAKIVGLDIDPGCLRYTTSRIRCFVGDASEPDVLRAALHGYAWDLIIDDGSHRRADQAVSLAICPPFLAEDGVFVVEDLQPSCTAGAFFPDLVPLGCSYALVACPQGRGPSYCFCGACENTPEKLLVVGRTALPFTGLTREEA